MQIKIDNKKLKFKEGKTILEIALENGINIPHLCYQENLKPEARCRMCVVECNGRIVASCSTKAKKSMVVKTNSEKVLNLRKLNTELLMAEHLKACMIENKGHELCKVVEDVGLGEIRFRSRKDIDIDNKSEAIVRDNSKCVLCGRCVLNCRDIQSVGVLDFAYRSHHTKICSYYEESLKDVPCIQCGQCVLNCPTDALIEKESIVDVQKAIDNPKKFVVVQTAPSARVSLGEEFGLEPGTNVKGKMVSALKKLGFDRVFDTDLGADFTIVEEAYEFVERLKTGKNLPNMTSCCPAWVKFCEHFYPEFLKNLSTSNSPISMLGPVIKTYFAKKIKKNPKDIVVVNIMPCTAKKFEIKREGLRRYNDYVLTVREAAKMMKINSIDASRLRPSKFDDPLGISTGAGAIFGVTGGVMEAVLRTAADVFTDKDIKKIDYKNVRGYEGVKEATVRFGNKKINVAVAHGMANGRKVIEDLKNKRKKYHFIEIMACPGGCIGGGGQPKPTDKEIRLKRISSLYKEDKKLPYRKAHKNPVLLKVYDEFLGKPFGKKAKKLLHTSYTKRELYS